MVSLFDKILGVEAAAAIGNSMGDVPEGLSYEQIEARYGFLSELLPQDEADCRAYVAGTIATEITGIAGLPPEWVQTVDDELKTDPYTVSRRSLRECAEGLYRALLNNVASLKQQIELVESQMG